MKTLVLVALLLIGTKSIAQDYKTAIGLRAGETSGLTIKHFIGGSSALEGIIGLWSHGLSLTLLYEKHQGVGGKGLNLYYGAGGHVAFETGYYSWYYHKNKRYYDHRHGHVGLGIDGVLGLEYKFPPVPIAISLDIKPFLEISSGGGIWTSLDPGLGIKVTL